MWDSPTAALAGLLAEWYSHQYDDSDEGGGGGGLLTQLTKNRGQTEKNSRFGAAAQEAFGGGGSRLLSGLASSTPRSPQVYPRQDMGLYNSGLDRILQLIKQRLAQNASQ